jgi:ABC-2 type transport system permease protein
MSATAKVNFKMSWRILSWTGFALRFFSPVMIVAAAWVLYNSTFQGSSAVLQKAGISNYLGFVVVGNALFAFVFASTFVVGRVMFWERAGGTLESTFMTPMSRLAYMSGAMIAATLNSLLDVFIVFMVGFFFGFRFTAFNPVTLIASLGLFAFAMLGVGLMVNGITLTFRDRTTAANTLTILFLAFSGVVAPVSLMPGWAQIVSRISPLTYATGLARGSLGVVAPPSSFDLITLAVLGVIYITIGAAMLKAVERNLRKKALFSVF